MPDPVLHDLWLLSLSANAGALAIGLHRRLWASWAALYLLSASALYLIDHFRWCGYTTLWIAQQLITVALLGCLTARSVRPTAWLVAGVAGITSILGVSLHPLRRWPDSPVEVVMWGCGLAALALGMIAAAGVVARRDWIVTVTAGFLLMYALLSLAGNEYLTDAGLGRAWAVMEMLAFGCWGGMMWRRSAP